MNQTYIIYSLILIISLSLLDFYLWRILKKANQITFLKWVIPFASLLFIGCIFQKVYSDDLGDFNASWLSNTAFGLAIGLLFTKIILALLFLIEDVYRIFHFSYKKLHFTSNPASFPERRDFVKKISLGIATLPFLGTIYAITKGKYNFHTKRLALYFDRLPPAFDGLKIVQFSDFHAGSFDDIEEVKRGLSFINKEQPDLILFTGDLVNNRTKEVYPYKTFFKEMNAKYGKFAILGNHDYGDYVPFDTEEARSKNLEDMAQFYKEAGFNFLRNEHFIIKKNNTTLAIIGVEDWGTGHFPKYGDIDKASDGLLDNQFKILLSHDPDHWEYLIRKLPQRYDLTLSGHTHGAQMGVQIPGWKWSPIKYRYKRWLGHYVIDKRQLFVSKGFGFLGFPGRVGMPPEIVSFTLHRTES